MKAKAFDCIKINRAAQERIRATVSTLDRKGEIEFFRAGTEGLEGRIWPAKKSLRQSS